MSIKSVHPLYSGALASWELGRDSYRGEVAIKQKRKTYLPPTSGQIADGANTRDNSEGSAAYDSYILRAIYPEIYKEAVDAAIGIMHKEPPNIELPKVLEEMRENATLLNEPLDMVLRAINAKQLSTGRLGLLGDIRVDGATSRPVIVMYDELSIRNWDDTSVNDVDIDLRLVVLDESDYVMQSDFSWVYENKYRVLGLVDKDGELSTEGKYASAVLQEADELIGAQLKVPNIMGKPLETIPFVFVNSKDLSANPDTPPLEGLANLCIAIYRGEADYRQHLFLQGQDTLVRVGVLDGDNEAVRVGTGVSIDVPQGGDAKFIGINSQGLPEQRSALENDYSRAERKSGQLIDSTSRAKESGDALRIRVAAQTATLPQIAKTGAAALEHILKNLAEWYGANPDEVKVTPNLNFTEAEHNGKTLVELVQAKQLGAPISNESLHEWLRTQGFTKLTYDQEIAKLNTEDPLDTVVSAVSPVDNDSTLSDEGDGDADDE